MSEQMSMYIITKTVALLPPACGQQHEILRYAVCNVSSNTKGKQGDKSKLKNK